MKNTENRRAYTDQKFQQLFDLAPLAYQSLDANGNLIRVNRAWLETLGYDREQVVGMPFKSFLTPQYVAKFKDRFPFFKKEGKVSEVEFEMVCKNKKTIFVSITGQIGYDDSGRFKQTHCFIQNITYKKKLEKEQQLIQKNLEDAQTFAKLGSWEWDVLNKKVVWSNEMYRIYEFDKDNFPYTTEEALKMRIHPEDYKRVKTVGLLSIKKGEIQKVEYRIITPEGKIKHILGQGKVIRDDKGNLIRIHGTNQDITEIKLAENTIKKQNEFLSDVIESLTHPFYVINAKDFTIELINSAAKNEKYHPGITCHELTHNSITPCGSEEHLCPVMTILKTKKPFKTEHIHYSGNKEPIYTEVYGYPLLDDMGDVAKIIEYSIDITDRKKEAKEKLKLVQQLQHAQKLEAIGTLAGGIAHEFNNILGVIMGYTDMSIDETQENSTLRNNLEQIMKSSERAKEMIQQILMFSRKSQEDKKHFRLSKLVEETVSFLRSSVSSTIKIKQQITAKTSNIFGSEAQISQILMNLCTNAVQSMAGKGGTLTIVLAKFDPDSEGQAIEDLRGREYLQLSIKDTGTGMKTEVLDRIFEPYFTTKLPGEGTGLGLAVVHGLIKNHNGRINVSSVPGEGSVFQVILPVSKALDTKPLSGQRIETFQAGGHLRILLIDDETELAKLGHKMLESMGYKVFVQNSSRAALEQFKKSPDEFDLVITDQNMPDLSGVHLAQKLCRIRPGIPIILCTGYSDKINELNFRKMGISGFVLKPIIKRDFARVIKKVVDSEAK